MSSETVDATASAGGGPEHLMLFERLQVGGAPVAIVRRKKAESLDSATIRQLGARRNTNEYGSPRPDRYLIRNY